MQRAAQERTEFEAKHGGLLRGALGREGELAGGDLGLPKHEQRRRGVHEYR